MTCIDEIISVSLDKWSEDWMSRQSLSAALAHYTDVTYIGQPKYPRGVKDLLTVPKRFQTHGLTVLDLPCWMNSNFEESHLHGGLSRHLKRRFLLRHSGRDIRSLLLWHPTLLRYLEAVSVDVTCYHVVDFFEGLARTDAARQQIRILEDELLRRVDVVFVIWKGLAERLGVAERAVLLPHGVDYDYYVRAARGEFATPADMPRGKPVAGFIGSIKSKTDVELLDKLAGRLSDWHLVMIGHDHTGKGELRERFERLRGRPNVYYLGLKAHADLAGYVQAFDVCLMPYVITDWTQYGLPLKMFEYFATGKPIVSTWLPSLEDYRGYIDVCTEHDEFIEAVARLQDGDSEQRRRLRMTYAAENTWKKQAGKMLEALAAAAVQKTR